MKFYRLLICVFTLSFLLLGCSGPNHLPQAHFGKHMPLHSSMEKRFPGEMDLSTAAHAAGTSTSIRTTIYTFSSKAPMDELVSFYEGKLKVKATEKGLGDQNIHFIPPGANNKEEMFVRFYVDDKEAGNIKVDIVEAVSKDKVR